MVLEHTLTYSKHTEWTLISWMNSNISSWFVKKAPCFAYYALCTSSVGTISVVYLIALVTLKAVHLGFHLEFHWFDTTQFYVPGKPPEDLSVLLDLSFCILQVPSSCYTVVARPYISI